jgi:hypothetical protein
MKRKGKLKTENRFGWSMTCKECPLLPHLKALKKEPIKCVVGLLTNAQGAIEIGRCEYLVRDTFDDKTNLFECSYANT